MSSDDRGRCQRIVKRRGADAQSTLFKGDVNERFHFVLAGCRRLERKWRRSKLQDSHVDACAILRNVVENVVQWAGHIQTSRDTVHREHFRAERRAPHRAGVDVTVDDARGCGTRPEKLITSRAEEPRSGPTVVIRPFSTATSQTSLMPFRDQRPEIFRSRSNMEYLLRIALSDVA